MVDACSLGDLMGTAFSSVTSGGPTPTPAPGLSLTSFTPPWLLIHGTAASPCIAPLGAEACPGWSPDPVIDRPLIDVGGGSSRGLGCSPAKPGRCQTTRNSEPKFPSKFGQFICTSSESEPPLASE